MILDLYFDCTQKTLLPFFNPDDFCIINIIQPELSSIFIRTVLIHQHINMYLLEYEMLDLIYFLYSFLICRQKKFRALLYHRK